MRNYWTKVVRRAGKEAFAAVFTNRGKAVNGLLMQVIAALLIYLVLGEAEVEPDVRLLVALAPFLTLPIIFIGKLVSVPAAIDEEQRREEDNERKGAVFYLTRLYLNEVNPEDAVQINYNLGLPPEEWMNAKLEELGFGWRVRVIKGPHYVTEDVP